MTRIRMRNDRSTSGSADDTPSGTTPTIGLCMAAAVTLVAEWILWESATRLGLWSALACHTVIVAGLAAWMSRSIWRVSRHGLLLVVSTGAFGPMGAAGVILSLGLERWQSRHQTAIEAWHDMLFPPPSRDDQADLWQRIGQRAHDQPRTPDVSPFLDILAFGSVPQRQSAVSIIAQQFNPAFGPALRTALRDPHNVIRVQAATVIARLEQEGFERTVELETQLLDAPDDETASLALARHFDDQAFAGLFDPARAEQYRSRAVELFEAYLRGCPDDRPVELRLARLLLRMGRLVDAESHLRRLSDASYPAARLWLMECLFSQGRYRDLREVAVGWSSGDGDDDTLAPGVRQAVDLWAGREAA